MNRNAPPRAPWRIVKIHGNTYQLKDELGRALATIHWNPSVYAPAQNKTILGLLPAAPTLLDALCTMLDIACDSSDPVYNSPQFTAFALATIASLVPILGAIAPETQNP